MIEFLILFAVLFLIAVLFYRQRHDKMEILQIEDDQADAHLASLLEERQPTIIRGATIPYSFTPTGLHQIPRLNPFPVGADGTLGAALANPGPAIAAKQPLLDSSARQLLANELAIPIWANRVWAPRLAQTSIVGSVIGTMQSEATVGGLGLRRTTAVWTCIFPTNGTYVASILSRDSEEFLPVAWESRFASSLTPNDTPLVGELRFMDVVLRAGTVLCLPPHTIVSVEPRTTSAELPMLLWMEYHEPMSLLAKAIISQN